MTESEIIKTLECCGESEHMCPTECPLYRTEKKPCDMYLMENTIDLINRKNAEIERLKCEMGKLLSKYPAYAMQMEVSNVLEARIKSEAIKEFADRLKEHRYGELHNRISFSVEYLDNLVKEMTENDFKEE